MKAKHIPGMAVGVFKYGKPLAIVTEGYADLENKVRVRRQTQFEICSITKQFTAAAVLLLVQDQRMRLDDPISKYVSGFPKTWSGVTVRRLLDHTSGVPDQVFDAKLTSLPEPEAIKKLVGMPLEFQPGERWSYNNTGYWLVGLAIAHASGEGYFDFLADRIFKPLGMKHTFPNRVDRLVPWRARGYAFADGAFKNAPCLNDEVGCAAGGLISTLDDMNIWSMALQSNKLLSAESRREMLTPAHLSSGHTAWNYAGGGYGLGVFVRSQDGHRIEKHSGGWDDASCQLTRFLDDGLTVAVLTNVGGYEQRSFVGERIAHLFLRSINPPSWEPFTKRSQAPTSLARKVLVALSMDRIPGDGVLTSICRQRTLANMQDISAHTGSTPLRDLQLVQRIPQGETSIYVFRATFKRPVIALLAVTRDNKVADLQLLEPPAAQ